MLRILRSLTLCTACLLLAGGALADSPAPAPPSAAVAPESGAGTAPTRATEPNAPLAQPPLPDFLLAETGGDCLPDSSGQGSLSDGRLGDAAQQPIEASTCGTGACTAPETSCSSGPQCRNFCLALVGEIGFCNPACGCCVCPDAPPPPPDPEPLPDNCVPICRCDGVPGPQGNCPNGCRLVNCV